MTTDESDGGARWSTRRLDVRRFRGGELALVDDPDLVATEEPFEIRLGYSRADGSRAEEPVSVTMRTPGYDEDLAVGFLFTEGIIRAGRDVQEVVARGQRAADGSMNVVRVELAIDPSGRIGERTEDVVEKWPPKRDHRLEARIGDP